MVCTCQILADSPIRYDIRMQIFDIEYIFKYSMSIELIFLQYADPKMACPSLIRQTIFGSAYCTCYILDKKIFDNQY